MVVVAGAQRPLASPGALPVVVCWLGDEFGGTGPEAADMVLSVDDVDEATEIVMACPMAAATMAVLLRRPSPVDVESGLAAESAAYSMLQGGPEFATWRAASEHRPSADTERCVLIERTDDHLSITLNRPQRHNAISTQLRDELSAALAIAIADDSIRAVTLSGAGRSFSSGGDLGEFGTRPDPVSAHQTRLARSPARLIHRLRDRITIEVHGATMGGGIEMAAFAGQVNASPDSRFALPEVSLGLIPGAGGTVSVTNRIGRQRTIALALTGRHIDAATALAWGLIDDVRAT